MAEVHETILENGIDAARKLAGTKKERRRVDTAFSVISDRDFEFSVLHSGFAYASLPHRAPKDGSWWRAGRIGTEQILLNVESGRSDTGAYAGIPCGSIARLILIFVFNEALKNKTRQVELGPSLLFFLRHMGTSTGGKSIAMIRDQSRRLAHCKLTFFKKSAQGALVNLGVLSGQVSTFDGDDPLRDAEIVIEIDKLLFDAVSESPILLRNAAMRSLFGRSMAMDLYIFLAFLLHRLHVPIFLSWTEFYLQFGGTYREQWVFMREVQEPLKLALAAYPEANVEITEHGLYLRPSANTVSESLWLTHGRGPSIGNAQMGIQPGTA